MERMIHRVLSVVALVVAAASPAWAHPTNGDLFFTTFSGGQNVWKTTYNYDGTTFTLGANTNIASTNGADGIIFAPDGDLIVGGQGNRVHKVKTDGSSVTTVTGGGLAVYHVMLDPSGTKVWGAAIPGDLAEIPLTPFANGVPHNVTGSVQNITHLAFAPDGTAYYTSSGAGGFGSFGTINMTTFVTTQVMSGVPAAHGMVYDPLTGDLILFGDGHVTQIDISGVPTVVSDRTFAGVQFDQGTVDGQGHLFGATNNGFLFFIDYSATGLIGDAGNFVASPFLANSLDDVAPLVGPGANPIPEPATALLVGLGAAASLLGLRRRKMA